jgi:gliding motility-associated-like protein
MKLHHLFLGLLTSICLESTAQVACFTIDHPKGCAPHTVTVSDACASGFSQLNYNFNYTGSGSFSPPTTNVYNTAGTFNIGQLLTPSVGVQPPVFIVPVTVVNAVQPTVTVKKCSGRQVQITINDTYYDSYVIDYGDGTTPPPPFPSGTTLTYTYATTTAVVISVTGRFGNSPCTTQPYLEAITPINSIPPLDLSYLEVTKESISDGEVQIHFNKNPDLSYIYTLKRGIDYPTDPTFTLSGTGPGPTAIYNAGVLTVNNINTVNEYQCVRIRTFEACNAGSVTDDEICSIRNFNIQPQNLQNTLTWQPYESTLFLGSTTDELFKDGTSIGVATPPRIDNNVVCATDYCYRIKTNIPRAIVNGGPTYSLSATKCVTAISTVVPTAVNNVNSTVNDKDIQVVFDAPTGFTVKTYQIFDAASGAEVANGTATNMSFAGNPGSCYKVRYQNECNNNSTESNTTCTVSLTADLAEDGSIALAWTPYTGYTATGIASYDILLLDENNQIIKTIPGGLGLTASDIADANAGRLFYMVRVNAGGAENLVSYSNKVELSLSPVVYIPDAFTPNTDGINDLFELKTRFVKSIDLTIFNRWGDPVFHSTELSKSWDGKVNGGDAPVGSYAYTLKIEGNKGESSTERGTLSLIR